MKEKGLLDSNLSKVERSDLQLESHKKLPLMTLSKYSSLVCQLASTEYLCYANVWES